MISKTIDKHSLFSVVSRLKGKESFAIIDIDQHTTIVSWPQGATSLSSDLELKQSLSDLERQKNKWLFGFLAYEAGKYFDRMPTWSKPQNHPDILFWETDGILIFDHRKETFTVNGSNSYVNELERLLAKTPHKDWLDAQQSGNSVNKDGGEEKSYTQNVMRLKKEIKKGNVYQANISWQSQPFHFNRELETWWNLRRTNPARHGAFMKHKNICAASNSPERFLQIKTVGQKRWVESAPIKGTARRADGLSGRIKLWSDEKERAELTMIVDLVRNDLGRVCKPGTIQPQRRRVRRCGDLYHAEQVIQGQLTDEAGIYDVLKATFPPGSVTGAPKIAAMELIYELEAKARGIYTGSIGFVSSSGDAHFNVAIRTIQSIDSTATFHVGAGIVHDSDPKKEWQETLSKGKALADSIQAVDFRDKSGYK